MFSRFVLFVLLAATIAPAGDLVPDADRWSGGIVGTVRGRFMMHNKLSAIRVYFSEVRKDEDVLAAKSLVVTDFHKGQEVYYLNADPGRYVVVAAMLERVSGQGRHGDPNTEQILVLFDKETIPQTEVEVVEGQVTFLGDILVELDPKVDRTDEAQMHYHWLIDPGEDENSILGRSGRHSFRGKLVQIDRDVKTEASCWKAAQKELKKHEEWLKRVQARLAELDPAK